MRLNFACHNDCERAEHWGLHGKMVYTVQYRYLDGDVGME